MKFWQRAMKSVTRKKGRSFILFLVIFILGNVIAGSVAIEQSTKNVEKETKQKMGPKTTVDMDYERFDREMQKNPDMINDDSYFKSPTLEEYEAIGQLSYVKYYDLSIPVYFGTNKIKAYLPEDEDSMYGGYGMGSRYSFNVKGVNRKEIVDIEDGLIRLEEGQTFTEKQMADGDNVVLISKEVAEANNLSVGDTFVLDVTGERFQDYTEEGSEEADEADEIAEVRSSVVTFDFPVKVAGIFAVIQKNDKDNVNQESAQSSQMEWMAMEQINTLYAPNELAKVLSRQQEEEIWGMDAEELAEEEPWYQVSYTLKSVDDVEAFREEGNALLSNKYYQVMTATDQYEQVAGGMQKLGTIARYVVIVAALATILIISLMVLLFLRDRKHELGIYLSFGERRSEIVGQIIIELLLIGGVALILSLITGNLLGGAISNSLLATDWIAGSDRMDGYYGNMMLMSDVSYQDIQSAYSVSFSVGYIVSYLLLGLGTMIVSAALPLAYILRLNPKKIMM